MLTRILSSPKRSRGTLQRRRHSERLGRVCECVAAGYLRCKGYRILARRVRSPYGEIDLIAVRGGRLAFIEVKYRESLGAAEAAVTHAQAGRMAIAAQQWAGRRPGYRNHHLALDAIYLAPWRMPKHVRDALQ